MLEALGDTALNAGEHDNAIARYTSALSLEPSSLIDTLVKRSKARASKELWKDALMDANEVIERDSSSHSMQRSTVGRIMVKQSMPSLLFIIENSPK
ncbi:hypothetical protein OG21DRAFT_159754 [Imleria badia]|nr:hypothetical protein OG21DRAFT_159754 [Imleria badia]